MSQILLLLFAVTGFLIFAHDSEAARSRRAPAPARAAIMILDPVLWGSQEVCPNVVVLKLTR